MQATAVKRSALALTAAGDRAEMRPRRAEGWAVMDVEGLC